MFQSVPNTELTCTICGGFWQDTDVKLRDLQRGEDQGCSTCNIMLQAINSFLPWILWRAGPLKAAILSVDAIVFHWDASNKAIYYEGTPEYPLYLSTDGEVETGHQLFSQHDTASGDTGTVASLRRIPPWINTCISQHSACGEPKDTPLPRRVLEIGETEGALIKLYESQNELARYACLSHRWGTGQPIVTTSESYDKLVKGIPSEELPLTFRDAVSVARRLSIRYLWIDCFCIIQDNAKDLEEACAMMDVIFENAFLTIAATRSEGPDDGLFVRRYAERRIQRLQIPGTEFWGKSDIYVRNFNHGEEDDLSSQHWITAGFSQGFSSGWPLLLRGWVFQERILSPRMLHFGNEITWECRSESVCECNFKASSGALQDSKHRLREEGCSLWSSESSTSTLHLTWKRVVEEYSELASNLTYERDIFPALSGLASRFSRLLSDEYVAGMWRKHLIQGLLWVVPSSPEGGVPLKWRAPTWSWASVCCAVRYVSISVLEETYAEVVSLACVQAGSSLSGELLSASLTLSVPTCQARLSQVKPKQNSSISRDAHDQSIDRWRIMWESCCEQCESQESKDGSISCRVLCTSHFRVDHTLPENLDDTMVECVRLACSNSRDWYLVLVRIDSAIEHYQRIGLTSKISPQNHQLAPSDKAELAQLKGAEKWQTWTIV